MWTLEGEEEGTTYEKYTLKMTLDGHYGPYGPVLALAVHEDTIISGSGDETIKLWSQ